MLRAAVERFGAHVAVGAGAAGAAAAAAVPTARCAKDEAKTVAPSFDPEALERLTVPPRETHRASEGDAQRERERKRGRGIPEVATPMRGSGT